RLRPIQSPAAPSKIASRNPLPATHSFPASKSIPQQSSPPMPPEYAAAAIDPKSRPPPQIAPALLRQSPLPKIHVLLARALRPAPARSCPRTSRAPSSRSACFSPHRFRQRFPLSARGRTSTFRRSRAHRTRGVLGLERVPTAAAPRHAKANTRAQHILVDRR